MRSEGDEKARAVGGSLGEKVGERGVWVCRAIESNHARANFLKHAARSSSQKGCRKRVFSPLFVGWGDGRRAQDGENERFDWPVVPFHLASTGERVTPRLQDESSSGDDW